MNMNWNKIDTGYYLVEGRQADGLSGSATYKNGVRVITKCRDDALIAQWDAEAVEVFAEINGAAAVAAAEAIIAPASRGVVALYSGRCARTGRFFPAGTHVERYMGKWAIVGTTWEAGAMDSEDSPF